MTAHAIIGRCQTCQQIQVLRPDGRLPTHGPHTGPACPGSQEQPLPAVPKSRVPIAWCPLCFHAAEEAHTACHNQVHAQLRQIPELYALLADALEPDRTANTHVSGSKLPPLPVRLHPLNLRGPGGVVSVLAIWETDWRRQALLRSLPARAGREQLLTGEHTLAEIIRWLGDRLWWAVDHYPAISEFAGDVRAIVRDCRIALGDLDDSMPIGHCPARTYNEHVCGARLRAYPQATAIRCDSCGTEWPKHKWPHLGQQINPPHEKDAA